MASDTASFLSQKYTIFATKFAVRQGLEPWSLYDYSLAGCSNTNSGTSPLRGSCGGRTRTTDFSVIIVFKTNKYASFTNFQIFVGHKGLEPKKARNLQFRPVSFHTPNKKSPIFRRDLWVFFVKILLSYIYTYQSHLAKRVITEPICTICSFHVANI